MNNIYTDRFCVTRVTCQRNEARSLMEREVFLAFHRTDDVPKPICTVTLWKQWNNWVDWVEVDEAWRRQGVATEILRAIEKRVGTLTIEGATEAGEAFCAAFA